MARLHVFADEAGNFDFRRADNVSRYFIVCTVVMPSYEAATPLLDLKRRLAWDQAPIGDYFHATTDAQIVRDAVFEEIVQHDFTVQATILEKSKAAPRTHITDATFYQYGWFYHFLYGLRLLLGDADEVHVTAASLGTKKGQVAFTDAVRRVVKQVERKRRVRTSFWPCQSDPCLQLTDYCTWAIQRKWERGDARAYDLIKDRVTYEYDTFQKERFIIIEGRRLRPPGTTALPAIQKEKPRALSPGANRIGYMDVNRPEVKYGGGPEASVHSRFDG